MKQKRKAKPQRTERCPRIYLFIYGWNDAASRSSDIARLYSNNARIVCQHHRRIKMIVLVSSSVRLQGEGVVAGTYISLRVLPLPSFLCILQSIICDLSSEICSTGSGLGPFKEGGDIAVLGWGGLGESV